MHNLLAAAPGWQDLIVCEGPNCDFKSVIKLVSVIINDLTYVATLLTVVACVIIGFTFLTSGGNEGAKTKAKGMATNVLIGYVVILSAWVVVHTITSVLLKNGYSIV